MAQKKRLQLRRHTDKNGNQASQEGLDRFYTEPWLVTDPGTVTEVFAGSHCGRTAQTAIAACCVHGIRARVIAPDSRFGSDELFDHWKRSGLIEAMKETGTLLGAVKAILSDDEYTELQEELMAATQDAFDQIHEVDGHGLFFCHSPIVEIVAEGSGLNWTGEEQLESCEGVMLEQDEDGLIYFTTLLKATPPDVKTDVIDELV